MSGSRERVEAALAAGGVAVQVKKFPASTRTAQQAADAIGCDVAQIVKSLVFVTRKTERAVLALVSGRNQADENKLAALLGEKVGKASAAFVRERTGFAIGGVAPVGHHDVDVVLADEDLLGFEVLWAAAGLPDAVFELASSELERVTGATICDLKRNV